MDMRQTAWHTSHSARSSFLLSVVALLAIGCKDGSEQLIGPTTGAIHITVSMAGPDQPTDVLVVRVNGGREMILWTTLPITISDLTPGAHNVRLDGVAPNCAVGGDNPRTAPVVAGRTTNVEFSLVCTATTGAVRVSTTMTGVDLDRDGFTVSIDDGYRHAVGLTGSVTFSGIMAGPHVVAVSGVARNCVIEGNHVRTVTVVAADTVEIVFTAACALLNGTMHITAVTTGVDPDPDGYLTFGGRLAANAGMINQVVEAAIYTVTLQDVAANCTVKDGKAQTVTVIAGETTEVRFHIECALATRIAYVVGGGGAIRAVKSNGTDDIRLTDERVDDPAWSPEGNRIAFTSRRDGSPEIYVANADGSSPTPLTTGGFNTNPTWSPDGSRIAFVSQREGNAQIYVMNADGTGITRLTNNAFHDRDPAWSPDGNRIAFTSGANGGQNIFVMNADGSGAVSITTLGLDSQPAWSPDGRKLAFTRIDCSFVNSCITNIIVKSLGGAGEVKLVPSSAPAWSPDGRHIAFTSLRCDYHVINYYDYEVRCSIDGIGIVETDGSPVGLIATGEASNPAWQR